MKHVLSFILLLALLSCVTNSIAADAYTLIDGFYARFEPEPGTPVDQDALEEYLQEAESQAATNPDSLEYRTAMAVVRAAWARERGVRGLGVLRQAREELESVITLDPDAMQGFAKAILARLYATVPGRPLSFGNKNRGMQLLEEVLTRFPDSSPVIYYAGLTFLEQDREARGRELLSQLESAPTFCDCPAWATFLARAATSALANE